MMARTQRTARGFTLVEVLVVLGIIAILAALVTPYAATNLSSDNLRESANTVTQTVRGVQRMAVVAGRIYALRFVSTNAGDQYMMIYEFENEEDNFTIATGASYLGDWNKPRKHYDRYGNDVTATPNDARIDLLEGVRFSPYALPTSSVHSAQDDYNPTGCHADKTLPRNFAGRVGADGEWGAYSTMFFLPDGSISDNFSITLMDGDLRYKRIRVGRLMGDLKVEDTRSMGTRE